MKPQIKIDIVSDVVCPWCYIGKRRLEKAINQLSDKYQFELEYHPFELNPEMPTSGVDNKAYLTKKFGGSERYEEITGHVSQIAAGEGLEFNFEKQAVHPNTRKAHSILLLAKLEGKQVELMEAFFKAYFTEGIDLSKDEPLITIGTSVGLSPDKIKTVLGDENALLQVALSEKEVTKLGITGVPFYIINERYGISGAQPAEAFLKAFEEIEKQPVAATGESCDVDGKNC